AGGLPGRQQGGDGGRCGVGRHELCGLVPEGESTPIRASSSAALPAMPPGQKRSHAGSLSVNCQHVWAPSGGRRHRSFRKRPLEDNGRFSPSSRRTTKKLRGGTI